MKLALAAAFLAACGDQGVSTEFEVHDTVHWSASMTPDVVELRVDGELLPSDQVLTIDETYPSYEEAKVRFVPRTLELTTTTATWTETLELGHCEQTPFWTTAIPLVEEAAQYMAWRGFQGVTGLGSNRGACSFADGTGGGWIAD